MNSKIQRGDLPLSHGGRERRARRLDIGLSPFQFLDGDGVADCQALRPFQFLSSQIDGRLGTHNLRLRSGMDGQVRSRIDLEQERTSLDEFTFRIRHMDDIAFDASADIDLMGGG